MVRSVVAAGTLTALALVGSAQAQLSGEAAIAACRATYGTTGSGYIGCLESALRGQTSAAATSEDTQPGADVSSAKAAAASVPDRSEGRGLFTIPRVFRAATVQERAAEPTSLDVVIVSVRYDGGGRGQFETEAGQFWRETVASPSNSHLRPGRRYEARIDRGALGGFRMNVKGLRRELKVEPLN